MQTSMSTSWLSRGWGAGPGRALIPLAAVALLATACPGDDAPPTDETTTATSSTGGSTGSMVGTSTTDPSTTGGTTTGADSTSTSSAGSESSGSSGDPPGSGYGNCLDDEMACAPGEVCISVGPFGVCAEQGCRSPEDCEMAPSGEAQPACDDIDNDFAIDCYLDCSGGEACPEGMTCIGSTACVWAPEPPGGGMCPDDDAGNMVPTTFMGDNTGLFDDVIQSCGGGGGDDALITFTAPANDTYRFDTLGTGFDTTLSIIDMCGGGELVCNDDVVPGMVLTSEVDLVLTKGQSVIVVVDSYDGQTGPYTLNIDQRGLGG